MNRDELLTAVEDKLKSLDAHDLKFIFAMLAEWDSWIATFETLADPDMMAQLNDPDTTTIPAELVEPILHDEEKLRELISSFKG